MIIFPPVMTFLFSGLFTEGIGFGEITSGSRDIFSLSGRGERERYNLIFFQASGLIILFLISLSLRTVSAFGISASYVFCGIATLLIAKRFGAVRGFATGFVCALAVSAEYSPAFALAGLAAGATFSFGTGYAVILGAAALSAWGFYSSGMVGLLTALPEYLLAAVLAAPLFKRIAEVKPTMEEKCIGSTAEDMIGTMALAYQNRFSGSLDSLEAALSSISSVIRSYSEEPIGLSYEEYLDIVTNSAEQTCDECNERSLCKRENIHPCVKNAEAIAKKLSEGERICADEINTDLEFCPLAEQIADRINRQAARAEQKRYALRDSDASAEEYQLISRLISGARARDDHEKSVDNSMTDRLNELVSDAGIEGGVIRVFGERRRRFFLAAEDPSGEKISSPELRRGIERTMGIRLGTPEFYKNGKMALMECGTRRSLRVQVAVASSPGDGGEVSGDSFISFESSDDFFYSLLSDGMGRGETAMRASKFVCDFMKHALETGAAKDTLIHMLNHILRSRIEECSASVDLFELDLLNAEATFIKSGAATSFIKRDSSIFRIRSQTAPIGLMHTIDTEKIRVEIKPGDYVIMISDGVADPSEDAPWLLLLLGEPPRKGLSEYAESILYEATKVKNARDDMTVAVIRIDGV
jgi:stage II sporulation protein E